MPVFETLLLATEGESDKCIDQYIKFKDALSNTQKVNQTYKLNCHDVNSIINTKGRGSNKLTDRLESKIKNCKLILVVCSPQLKKYLDEGGSCSHKDMGELEASVLKQNLPIEESKGKMILVYLNSDYKTCIPKILEGVEVVDGVNDIGQLLEVKIPGKLNLGSQ